MKRVLTIAYFYPPYDSTAGLEASKLTKYLPEFGWEPEVVAAENDFPPTLPIEIDHRAIHRTRQIDVNRLPKALAGPERVSKRGYVVGSRSRLGRFVSKAGLAYRQTLNFPDGQVGWYPYAVREARRILATRHFDALLSIAWPVTTHLVAARVKKRVPIPWVADFRDLWTDNHHFQRARGLRGVEAKIERRTMRHMDAATTPSDDWSGHLARRFGLRTYTVPNAYEPGDYPTDAARPTTFTMTYTGVLYPGSQNARPLLGALKRLLDDATITPETFRLQLVGRYVEQLQRLLDEHGVASLADISPTVPHEEALRRQSESSVLLFLLWTQPSGVGWYSAKVYEYLGARRPILAIGPRGGAASRLLERVDGCVVAETASEVETALRRWIAEHESKGDVAPLSAASVEPFDWRHSVAVLAQALDETVSSAARR